MRGRLSVGGIGEVDDTRCECDGVVFHLDAAVYHHRLVIVVVVIKVGLVGVGGVGVIDCQLVGRKVLRRWVGFKGCGLVKWDRLAS